MLSVLIANYNNSRFLETCINSVVQQTLEDWEIVLVDDGSTDQFEQVIRQFTRDKRLRIFRNVKNMGCGYTKNRCAELAFGNVLAFLDPDDALAPEALAVMKKAHQENPECSLIHSTHFICNEELVVTRVAEYTGAVPAQIPYLFLSDGRIHHFASFKKNCYDRSPRISPLFKKAVDQDLYYKLEEQGFLFYINRPLYYYRIHPGAISNAGKENEATLWHYQVIAEACMRRINFHRMQSNVESPEWVKKYRARYYKIKILRSFRKKNWAGFLVNVAVFPFVGGFRELKNYAAKLLNGESGMLKKTFIENYEIKA